MKIIVIVFASILLVNICTAQKIAITDTGEEVFLYSDGTWQYVSSQDSINLSLETNPKEFAKNEGATFLLKSKAFNVGVWLNPQKWKFTKSIDNPDAEYEFQRKGEDLYGIMITEKIEIKIDSFREIALMNARVNAPDIKIVKQEYRMVNGLKVLYLQMDGTVTGIDITYHGYYYSNSNGTVQLLTFTSQNLMDQYLNEIEGLLNGIVEIEQ